MRTSSDAGTPKAGFKPGTSPPPWPMPPQLAKEASAAGKTVEREAERPPSAAAARPAPSSPRAVATGTRPDAKAADRAADARPAPGTVKAAAAGAPQGGSGASTGASVGGAPPPPPLARPPAPAAAPTPPVVRPTAAAPGSSLLRPPSMGSLGPSALAAEPAASTSAAAVDAALLPADAAAPRPAPSRWAGFLGLANVAHHVRLRKRLPLGPRGLSGELGLDTDLKSGATLRTAAVTYELEKGGRPLAALRVSPGGVHACRVFTLTLPFTGGRVAVRARGLAGLGWNRRPEFSVDVDDVRPVPLVAAAAGAALASGKGLSLGRPLATAVVRVPSLYDAWTVRADGRFAAQRTQGGRGGGVAVDVKEVSFFLDV